jgi:hypothetical protein
MSYYYNYYICIEDKKTGNIKPLGPYDCNGKLKSIIERSRNFASDLYKDFYNLPQDKISDELRKEFEYEDWNGEKKCELKYLPYDKLPEGDYIVKGYFLIEDLQAWKQGGDDSLFYSVIEPQIYAELLKKEIIFGKNQPEKDEEGIEYTKPNASDYIYSAVPNYFSKEYEVILIRRACETLMDYDLADKYNVIIVETEG